MDALIVRLGGQPYAGGHYGDGAHEGHEVEECGYFVAHSHGVMVVRLRLVEKRVCVCFALFLLCFGVKELGFIYAFYAWGIWNRFLCAYWEGFL